MKVYILTDLEGVSGVVNFDDDTTPGARNYERSRKLLVGETNAAIEGCLAAGASEILVLDGHGGGGLNLEDVHPEAKLLLGRPLAWPFELDSSYDAVILLAHHSMNGTPDGNLSHTYSHVSITNMWLNGEKIGEIGMEFALAGYFAVPVVLVTGDEAACREARKYTADVEVAPVKRGISLGAALCLHPQKARALIRDRAEAALRRAREIPAYRVDPPFEIRTEFVSSASAFSASQRPDVELIDSRTVAVRGNDLLEVIRRRSLG